MVFKLSPDQLAFSKRFYPLWWPSKSSMPNFRPILYDGFHLIPEEENPNLPRHSLRDSPSEAWQKNVDLKALYQFLELNGYLLQFG